MKTGILQTNYRGNWCVLCDMDGQPVPMGARVKDFRGESAKVMGGEAPHKDGSTGRVSTNTGIFYAGVFGLCWVEVSL